MYFALIFIEGFFLEIYKYVVWSGQAELVIESNNCFQSLYVDSCLAAIHPKLLG